MNQVEQWRKGLVGSCADAADLGATAATFSNWTSSLWEIWGDGRAVVKSLQRRVLLLHLLKEQEVLPQTIGTAKLIGSFISKMAGVPSFEAAVAGSVEAGVELSAAERAVFELAAAYFEKLGTLGLIESGHALQDLAQLLPQTKVYLVGDHELLPNQEAFLQADCIELAQDEPYDPVIRGWKASSEPTVLLPAGPSALPRMVFDAALHHLQGGEETEPRCSLIATHSAEVMLAQLLSPCADAGINVAARFRKQFACTDFGRAFHAAFNIATALNEEDACSVAFFADYLRNPFARVGSQRVSELDAQLRGNRRIGLQEACDLVLEESPNYEVFASLFSAACNVEAVTKHFIAEANVVYADDHAACAQEVAAINALKRAYEQVMPLVESPLEIAELLEERSIDVSSVLRPDDPVQLLISDLNALGVIRRHSYSQVILSHVTADDFSMKTPQSALDTLMRKLGVDPARDVLRTGRLYFNGLLDAASDSFVVALPVNSGGDEDVYPAFFIEEYFESLRAQGEEPDDDEAKRLNVPFGIPKVLYPHIVRRGEGELAANAFALPEVTAEEMRHQGDLDDAAVEELLHFREVDGKRLPVLSPSQIELYLSCPYQWFISRKVKPDGLNAQFGPLERGMFVHRVFDETYRLMQAAEMPRVRKDNLDAAQKMLGEVFDLVLAQQQEPDSEGYIPLTESELHQAEQLKMTLMKNLALHAELLPDYTPKHFEYQIDPEQDVVFAGACIVGRIDRIDCDAEGNLVVLDYKGSAAGHECGFQIEKDLDEEGRLVALPKKVQGLIYAAAAQRLGLGTSVGALYLSYKAEKPQQFVRGSYNETKLDLGPMAHEKCTVDYDLLRYLDLVEDFVADEVARMVAGKISPAPRYRKDSCAFCPVVDCPKRVE